VDGLAVVAIVGLITLASNRMINPVTKMLTGPADWLNIIFVLLPLITGWAMYHHIFGLNYTKLTNLHLLTVNWLLIWTPFSRISHFLTYFITKTMHGAKFGRLGVEP
jgi:nitrate reductase gamma subunit